MDKRILIIQPWLNYRGAESVSLNLLNGLNDSGVNAKIFCLFVSDTVEGIVDENRVILPPLFWRQLLKNKLMFVCFGFFVMSYYLFKYCREFDILNPHNFPSVWSAIVVGTLLNKKVVWSVHNFPQHPFRGLIGSIYDCFIYPFDFGLCRQCTRIVSVSQKVADQVGLKYDMKSEVIYPAVDTNLFSSSPGMNIESSYENIVRGKKVLLQVGQIRSEKCQKLTVSLFESICELMPDLVLVFIGERKKGYLDDIGEMYRNRILFANKVTKLELSKWYRLCEVIISPSYWGEGCTLVPIEAMAAGAKKVFVAKGCGVDELLYNHELKTVFDPMDSPDNISAQLVRLLNSDENTDYSDIVNLCNVKSFTNQYIKLIDSI
ncbi:MAG: glycosyltransferase family 4 protein [bacterium]|nr:glycosyltransferase family 4 protein [bacterium]